MVHAPTEYTVVQAAKFLDMSEACVDDFLNMGRIAFRMENGERLIQWKSMLEFKQDWDHRQTACTQLIHFFQEMGLSDDYDD
jgi:hypothetical protein